MLEKIPTAPDQLRDTLARDGFVAIDQITDADDIAVIRDEFETMIASGKLSSNILRDLGQETWEVTQNTMIMEINGPTRHSTRLQTSRTFQAVERISQAILGPAAKLQFDHCIIKAPLSPEITAWHQDSAYSRRITFAASRRLHWWIPLQAVNERNGCMQFVAGSHLGKTLPHRHRSAKSHALETDLPYDARVTKCPLPVGGATIHTLKTLHFTGPNLSNAPRYAWIVQFGIKSMLPRIVT